jgi:RNA polymerase sigma factor (sigma-70 family)
MPLDADAITVLYDRHARDLVAYFQRRTYDAEAAVDLTAETFAAAFEGRARFRGDGDEATAAWLYGIARHQLLGFYRRGRVERRALAQLGVERRPLEDGEIERIEALAGTAGRREEVARRLAGLSAEHRRVLELRVIEERSYGEVAALLKVTEPTARQRVSRALRALSAGLAVEEP